MPGRFVGANLESDTYEDVSEVIGHRASVDGGGGSPDLFPGLTGTVTASGLTPGEELEVWVAPDLDYFFLYLLGGGLPVSAVQVGSDTVAADGTFAATIDLLPDLAFGRYQLVVGDSAERYWPAGSYGDFTVTAPPGELTDTTVAGEPAELTIGLTTVTAAYPASWSGETKAVVTSTGPRVDGFSLTTDPPLYYHLSTSEPFSGLATVCFEYNPLNLPGQTPRLYHFDTTQAAWIDITTTRSAGRVCGETSSFSPFALGYPDEFDFDGFFSPVSMDAENLAKPGQAIPVKFSLNGDQGLDVVTSAHFVVEGTDTTPEGQLIPATTTGGSGLSYSASSDQYTYVWKTAKTLSLKTGRFELTLSDGTVHTFNVTFKK